MAIIKEGVSDPNSTFNLNGLDYKKGIYEIYYSNIEVDNSGNIDESKIQVGIRNQHNVRENLQYPQKVSDYKDSGGTPYSSLEDLITDLVDLLGFNIGGGGVSGYPSVEFRADLPITLADPAIGTVYLVEKPTTILFGTYTTYQSGLYIKDADTGSLNDWRRLNMKNKFLDTEFFIADDVDQSKQFTFQSSNITSGFTRIYTVPNKSGTLALLSDIPAAFSGNHSDLNLDDGSNPHGTNKSDVGLGSVPNIDATQRSNHAGTQTASTISDFDTEVSNNTNVLANTAKVSADGSVTTHSDVTDAGSGAIITGIERTKLGGIESGATADQSDAEIETAYNNQVDVVSQAEAEAGVSTTVRRWTAQRVKQAIDALGGGSVTAFMEVENTNITTNINGGALLANFLTVVPVSGTTVTGSDTGSFTKTTNGIQCDFNGTVLISATIHVEGDDVRPSPHIRCSVGGTLTGPIGSSTYIRQSGDHIMSSATITMVRQVTNGQEILVNSRRGADFGGVVMQAAGTSNLSVIRLT